MISSRILRHCCRPLTVSLTIAAIHGATVVAEDTPAEVPIEQVISIIQANESKLQVIEFQVDSEVVLLSDPQDFGTVLPGDPLSRHSGLVRFEPLTRRYLCHLEQVLEWQGGSDPNLAGEVIYAFDGAVHRQMERRSPGRMMPAPSVMPSGTISASLTSALEQTDVLSGKQIDLGLTVFPPFFSDGEAELDFLSAFLLSAMSKPWQVTAARSTPNSPLVIRIIENVIEAGPHDALTIVYDEVKGIITTVVHDSDQTPSRPWRRLEVEPVDCGGGIWLPGTVNISLAMLQRPYRCLKARFSDIKVNAPVDSHSFTFEFKPGTRLSDSISGRSLVVANAPEQDSADVDRFISDNRLRLRTEDRRRERGVWLTVANLGFLVAACVAFVLVRIIRKHRKQRVNRAAAAGFFSATSLLFISDSAIAANSTLTDSPGPYIGYNELERIYPRECGVMAAHFCLKLLQVPYFSGALRDGFTSTEEGTSAKELADCLRTYGLVVHARSEVNRSDLMNWIVGRRIAVLPLQSVGGLRHYFVAFRDEEQGVLLVDPPIGVRPLSEALSDESLRESHGFALLVERPEIDLASGGAALAESVSVTPAEVLLGKVFLDGRSAQDPIECDVELMNFSGRAVSVSGVATSCGCTIVDWKGGVLLPDRAQKLHFTLQASAFSGGVRSRVIRVLFPDGSEKKVLIKGEGVTGQDVQGFDFEPQQSFVDLVDALGAGVTTLELHSRLSGKVSQSGPIRIEFDVPWLQCHVQPPKGGADKAQLNVNVDLTHPEVISAGARKNGVSGVVRAFATNSEHPVEFTVQRQIKCAA